MSQFERCERCGIDESQEIIEKYGNELLCPDCINEVDRYDESCTRGL